MKYWLSAFLLVCILASCQKEERYFDVDADIVSAFSFPANSYWILKDSATGELDSLARAQVTSHTDIIGMDARSTTRATSYYTDVYEYREQATDTAAIWQFQFYNDGEHNWVSLMMKLRPAYASVDLTAYNPLFSRPAVNGFTDQWSNQTNEVEVIPVITINGQQFDSVYHVRYYSTNGRKDEHFYFNLKVGVIKYEQHWLNLHRTLELERWYVPR